MFEQTFKNIDNQMDDGEGLCPANVATRGAGGVSSSRFYSAHFDFRQLDHDRIEILHEAFALLRRQRH